MTLREAKRRAAELTKAGSPTMAMKATGWYPGGYRTRNIASDQRHRRSAKARATRQRLNRERWARVKSNSKALARWRARNNKASGKYRKTPKGRAASFRTGLGRGEGHVRLNRRGERFRLPDLRELRVEQKRRCLVCDKPLKGKLRNGKKDEVVEHGHHDGFVRTLSHHRCNTLLGIIEALKIPVHTLHIWITRVQAALMMPWLSMTADEIRLAKRRAKKYHIKPKRRT